MRSLRSGRQVRKRIPLPGFNAKDQIRNVNLFRSTWSRPLWAFLMVVAGLTLAFFVQDWRALVPSVLALALVVLLRRAAAAIWTGALVGLWIAADFELGRGVQDGWATLVGIFTPGGWRFYAVIFTVLMGGFAVMLEGNGGFERLVARMIGRFRDRRKGVQWTTCGAGLLCFFDGLASSVMVGRLMRKPAEMARLSGAKLSYLVDSTSSSVTCLAFVSTWIAFQLGMITEGLEQAGWEANAYGLFFRTIPFNFYCLLTLVLVFLAVRFSWHPGPMARREAEMKALPEAPLAVDMASRGGLWRLFPLPVLVVCLFGGMYWSGSGGGLPRSFAEIGDAFGAADAGLVLVISASIGIACVWVTYGRESWFTRKGAAGRLALGMRGMLPPVGILLGAWMLGASLSGLGTADMLVGMMGDSVRPVLLIPALFIVAALVGLSTGTSWGTIGILLPLAIPLTASLGVAETPADGVVPLAIAAVFGGAVFGDHCSPLSDTTIVSAAACGVDPREHALTQAPYAGIAAGGALVLYALWALLL